MLDAFALEMESLQRLFLMPAEWLSVCDMAVVAKIRRTAKCISKVEASRARRNGGTGDRGMGRVVWVDKTTCSTQGRQDSLA